jgi:hypothetical protein
MSVNDDNWRWIKCSSRNCGSNYVAAKLVVYICFYIQSGFNTGAQSNGIYTAKQFYAAFYSRTNCRNNRGDNTRINFSNVLIMKTQYVFNINSILVGSTCTVGRKSGGKKQFFAIIHTHCHVGITNINSQKHKKSSFL